MYTVCCSWSPPTLGPSRGWPWHNSLKRARVPRFARLRHLRGLRTPNDTHAFNDTRRFPFPLLLPIQSERVVWTISNSGNGDARVSAWRRPCPSSSSFHSFCLIHWMGTRSVREITDWSLRQSRWSRYTWRDGKMIFSPAVKTKTHEEITKHNVSETVRRVVTESRQRTKSPRYMIFRGMIHTNSIPFHPIPFHSSGGPTLLHQFHALVSLPSIQLPAS